MIKFDGSVRNLGHGILRVFQRGLRLQDFGNAAHGLNGHGEHDVNHRNHHQTHQNLKPVGQHRRDLSHVDGASLIGDDELCAHKEHEDHVEVKAKLHQRAVQCHDALGVGKVTPDVVGGGSELFLLILLSGKALDHTHGTDVFLDGFIHPVVFLEHRAESRHCFFRDHDEAEEQHRNHHDKGHREAPTHQESHHHRENQHQRRTHRGTDRHHEGHLDVADVRGHPGDERRRRKAVDVLKGEALDPLENIPPQIPRKARRSPRPGKARRRAAGERQQRHQYQHQPQPDNRLHLDAGLDAVNQFGGIKRDQDFNEDLPDDQQQRQDGGLLKLPHAAQHGFNQRSFPILQKHNNAYIIVVRKVTLSQPEPQIIKKL